MFELFIQNVHKSIAYGGYRKLGLEEHVLATVSLTDFVVLECLNNDFKEFALFST